MLPNKFKNLVWVKRGDYVIAESATKDYMIKGGESGKIRFLIVHILQKSQILDYVSKGIW